MNGLAKESRFMIGSAGFGQVMVIRMADWPAKFTGSARMPSLLRRDAGIEGGRWAFMAFPLREGGRRMPDG
ncbi:hypothetical protein [Bifidobacterium simiarum]|uniref:hypothetical protein n=1 Tax=Bifidobacterium simiarum TaxID=2045441 RepID=UPI001BDD77F5|nr:hypothetical protein [Bifidobacterium simiarum]MBT1165939.1 hypothetical protein [Bifidobacterium simiarum]